MKMEKRKVLDSFAYYLIELVKIVYVSGTKIHLVALSNQSLFFLLTSNLDMERWHKLWDIQWFNKAFIKYYIVCFDGGAKMMIPGVSFMRDAPIFWVVGYDDVVGKCLRNYFWVNWKIIDNLLIQNIIIFEFSIII